MIITKKKKKKMKTYKLENVFVNHYAPIQMLAPKDKRHHQNFMRFCPNVNQVIYTLDTICIAYHDPSLSGLPDIRPCSQGPLWVQCLSLNRGIIQSNIYRIL